MGVHSKATVSCRLPRRHLLRRASPSVPIFALSIACFSSWAPFKKKKKIATTTYICTCLILCHLARLCALCAYRCPLFRVVVLPSTLLREFYLPFFCSLHALLRPFHVNEQSVFSFALFCYCSSFRRSARARSCVFIFIWIICYVIPLLYISLEITKCMARQPLASYKRQPCLFAWSTSLPAPLRVVSTWCSHSRDHPNSATMLPSKWTRQPKNTNERQILSTAINIRLFSIGSRFLIIFSIVFEVVWFIRQSIHTAVLPSILSSYVEQRCCGR